MAGLYNENYPKLATDNASSYLWPYDGLVSGVATLKALGVNNIDYEAKVEGFEKYFSNKGSVGGYSSQTNGNSGLGDRFYDDNSIVGLDLVEAYHLSPKLEYLERCAKIVKFLRSGEDDKLGGALWWNESLKNMMNNGDSNKPACSNGYATLFLLKYYEICPAEEKAEVLAFAKRLYAWLKTHLRDPSDGCYWNDKQVSGEINKRKWTYNTGVMISNGVYLYRFTSDETYLNDAKTSAQGSYDYFVRPVGAIPLTYPDHDPWFTVKLVKSYIDIEPYLPAAKGYIDIYAAMLDRAYSKARSNIGFYYEDWTGQKGPGRMSNLLQQAAALEALGMIAKYKSE